MTIHEAASLIGVSEATLRRWAEAGDVPAFVTPGGHRRFSRAAILDLLPSPVRPARSLRDLGETPERVVRQYRQELARAHAAGWMPRVDDSEREEFRAQGRLILAAVLRVLDAASPSDSEAEVATAEAASARYGRLARAQGLSAREATGIFLRFRAPFLDELAKLARRRRVEPSQAATLLLAAVRVFDRLLLALLDGHAARATAKSREAEPEAAG